MRCGIQFGKYISLRLQIELFLKFEFQGNRGKDVTQLMPSYIGLGYEFPFLKGSDFQDNLFIVSLNVHQIYCLIHKQINDLVRVL